MHSSEKSTFNCRFCRTLTSLCSADLLNSLVDGLRIDCRRIDRYNAFRSLGELHLLEAFQVLAFGADRNILLASEPEQLLDMRLLHQSIGVNGSNGATQKPIYRLLSL